MRKASLVVVVLLFATVAGAQQWAGSANTTGVISREGTVGIGTATPASDIHVRRGAGDASLSFQTDKVDGFAYARFTIPAFASLNNTAAGFFFQQGSGNHSAGNRFYSFGMNPARDTFVINGGDAALDRLAIKANGFVGIGTGSPNARLDVNGDVNVTGNIAAKYQDLAEWVPATDNLEPGTVVVLNTDKSNEVMASMTAYDTAVAGVVSAQPGLILGEKGLDKEMIATTGRVKVRVDASKAPIKVGDLLVTSGKSGVAMKSQPVEMSGIAMHRPGTIIGKALEPLASGEGMILVLLSMQ